MADAVGARQRIGKDVKDREDVFVHGRQILVECKRPLQNAPREELYIVKTLINIRHPNIAKLYGLEDGKDYRILIEYGPDGTLAQEIRMNRLLHNCSSQERVLNVLWQVNLALEFLHGVGFIHRDLKPASIMMFKDVIKIGGFEQAVLGQSVKSNVGAPPYCAPEAYSDAKQYAASDMWSLGVILYEMMANRPPFAAHNLPALADRICMSSPRRLPSRVDARLRHLIDRLLSKAPWLRPSARDVRHDTLFSGDKQESQVEERSFVDISFAAPRSEKGMRWDVKRCMWDGERLSRDEKPVVARIARRDETNEDDDEDGRSFG